VPQEPKPPGFNIRSFVGSCQAAGTVGTTSANQPRAFASRAKCHRPVLEQVSTKSLHI
jgi:hypothetical protein